MLGNEQTAAETASGSGCTRKVKFGDDAQRAFGADEQTRQIVACRGLAGAGAGLDDASVGHTTVSASTLSRMVP